MFICDVLPWQLEEKAPETIDLSEKIRQLRLEIQKGPAMRTCLRQDGQLLLLPLPALPISQEPLLELSEETLDRLEQMAQSPQSMGSQALWLEALEKLDVSTDLSVEKAEDWIDSSGCHESLPFVQEETLVLQKEGKVLERMPVLLLEQKGGQIFLEPRLDVEMSQSFFRVNGQPIDKAGFQIGAEGAYLFEYVCRDKEGRILEEGQHLFLGYEPPLSSLEESILLDMPFLHPLEESQSVEAGLFEENIPSPVQPTSPADAASPADPQGKDENPMKEEVLSGQREESSSLFGTADGPKKESAEEPDPSLGLPLWPESSSHQDPLPFENPMESEPAIRPMIPESVEQETMSALNQAETIEKQETGSWSELPLIQPVLLPASMPSAFGQPAESFDPLLKEADSLPKETVEKAAENQNVWQEVEDSLEKNRPVAIAASPKAEKEAVLEENQPVLKPGQRIQVQTELEENHTLEFSLDEDGRVQVSRSVQPRILSEMPAAQLQEVKPGEEMRLYLNTQEKEAAVFINDQEIAPVFAWDEQGLPYVPIPLGSNPCTVKVVQDGKEYEWYCQVQTQSTPSFLQVPWIQAAIGLLSGGYFKLRRRLL